MPKISTSSPKPADNKQAVFAALDKKYKLSVMPSIEPVSQDDILSTPSTALNLICGPDRGIRKGSIVHWYGPESSLKSWLALEMCREAQKKWPSKIVLYIDTEYRVDLNSAVNLIGVDLGINDGVPSFIYRRPENAEQAWEEIGACAASGHFSLIVLDSNSAMRSKSVAENPEFSLGQVGSAARINSAALQKYAPVIAESGAILWAVSQMRITSVQPVVTKGPTGGAAWGYYATHEFRCERVAKERGEEDQELQIFAKKMKWAPSLKTCLVPVTMGKGVDVAKDLLNCAVEAGIIQQSGSWYSYGDNKLGQGDTKAAAALQSDSSVYDEVQRKVYESL